MAKDKRGKRLTYLESFQPAARYLASYKNAKAKDINFADMAAMRASFGLGGSLPHSSIPEYRRYDPQYLEDVQLVGSLFFEALGRGDKDAPGSFYSVLDLLRDDLAAVGARPEGDPIREGVLYNPDHGSFPRLWQALDDADGYLKELLDARLTPPGEVLHALLCAAGHKVF